MYFTAWNGEKWSGPFQPNELHTGPCGGVYDDEGFSISWDEDGFRGENWLALKDWTEEKAKAIMSGCQRTPIN